MDPLDGEGGSMKKRLWIIAFVVLCLTMVLTFPVYAAEPSGTCGENVTWELDTTTGVMTISGQGEMDDGRYSPWWDYRTHIKTLVIQEGVTSVSSSAFAHCQDLETVVLPKSVKSIQKSAFSGCVKLTSIDLTHITSLGEYAFMGCGFSEVIIPAGISSVSYGAFSDCKNLKSVVFHNNVTELESYAFSGCTALTAVHLPDQMQIIGSSAFNYCAKLVDLEMNEGLLEIRDNAFSCCYQLESVVIPDTVNVIDKYAFNRCKALSQVILGAGISRIDVQAFNECKSLSAFTLSSENTSFSVHQGVLYSKDRKQLMIMADGFTGDYAIPEGTTSIASNACDSSNLSSLTIPGSVETVGQNSFAHCTSLKTIVLQNGVQVLRLGAFRGTPITEITMPESVTKIYDQAFAGCDQLTKIKFEGAPPEIQEIAFSEVEADVYHPAHIAEWEDAEHLYGGLLEWIDYCTGVHVPVENTIKAPTCTESGLAGETLCKFCSKVIEGQKEIPATGHKFGAWIEKTPPTADKEGLAVRTCSGCGVTEQKVLEKLPQEPSTPVGPDQPSEPTVPESTPATEPDHPVASEPTGTEPTTTELPSKSESSVQNEPDGVKWVAVVIAAVVSLAIGLGAASLIFRRNKDRS